MAIKIGVFDSGVGGITVLNELKSRFSSWDYVYLGDTANVPYGPKSPAQIQKLSIHCAQLLKQKKVNGVIVACNTASSWALSEIRAVMGSTPVIGMVEPGVTAALEAIQGKDLPILVLATRATVQSHAYQKAFQVQLGHESKLPLFEQACPLLVPLIEESWIDHPVLHQTLNEYLRPYRDQFSQGIAVLGCTHYPWILPAIERALPGWIVVNSASAVVQGVEKGSFFSSIDTQASLMEGEENSGLHAKRSLRQGKTEWIFTDPDAVPDFARKWISGN